MSKYRAPTEEEKRIIRENGIDPDKTSLAVSFRTPDSIHILIHKTRDEVVIRKGERPW